MLAVLVFALGFFALCWLYGLAFLRLAARLLRIEPQPVRAVETLLAGMIALTTLAAALSLALPLDWRALAILILGGAAIFLSGSRRGWIMFRLPRFPRFRYGMSCRAGAAAGTADRAGKRHSPGCQPRYGYLPCSGHPMDGGIPAVAGLGNLHSRFAYNSHWLVLNAVFSLAFWGGHSLHLAGAMLFGLAVWDFSNGLRRWLNG